MASSMASSPVAACFCASFLASEAASVLCICFARGEAAHMLDSMDLSGALGSTPCLEHGQLSASALCALKQRCLFSETVLYRATHSLVDVVLSSI
jgi:hypothetical protein